MLFLLLLLLLLFCVFVRGGNIFVAVETDFCDYYFCIDD